MDDPGRLLGPASRDAAAALAGSVGARAAGPLWPVWPAGLAETAGVAGVAGAAYGEGCAAGVPDDKVCCQRIAGAAAMAGVAANHTPADTRPTLKARFKRVECFCIGMNRNPVWYYNIVAHPDILIMVDGEEKAYRARRVSDEEKRDLWPHLLSMYPDFDEYQARTDRNIPVFSCQPLAG